MQNFLLGLFVVAVSVGWIILQQAKSAIHEIEAFMIFLIGAVLLIGAAIIEGITQARKKMEEVIKSEIVTATAKAEALLESRGSNAAKKMDALVESAGLSAFNTGNAAQLLKAHLSTLAERTAKESPQPAQEQKATAAKPYYYSVDGGQLGPYALNEVQELRASGVIDDKTLVFKKGDTEWRNLGEFSECAPS